MQGDLLLVKGLLAPLCNWSSHQGGGRLHGCPRISFPLMAHCDGTVPEVYIAAKIVGPGATPIPGMGHIVTDGGAGMELGLSASCGEDTLTGLDRSDMVDRFGVELRGSECIRFWDGGAHELLKAVFAVLQASMFISETMRMRANTGG